MSKSKLICNKLFSNPFFIALLLTVLVIIIMVAIFKVQKNGSNAVVKCFIYTYICFSIILFVHTIFIKKTLNVSNVKKEVKDVFSGIDISKEVSHDVIQIQPNLYDDEEEDLPYIKKRNGSEYDSPKIHTEEPNIINNAPNIINNDPNIINRASKIHIEYPSIMHEEPKIINEAPKINETTNILNSIVSMQ